MESTNQSHNASYIIPEAETELNYKYSEMFGLIITVSKYTKLREENRNK